MVERFETLHGALRRHGLFSEQITPGCSRRRLRYQGHAVAEVFASEAWELVHLLDGGGRSEPAPDDNWIVEGAHAALAKLRAAGYVSPTRRPCSDG